MKIDLLDIDTLIDVNKLREVTSVRLFSNKMTFEPGGLLSHDIFGQSKSDRRSTFAYITLKRHFIHPHLYDKVIKRMQRNITYCISGQRKFIIRDGIMVEDETGWTGIDKLYEHWDEIDWSKSKSANQVNKELMKTLKRDDVFIDKMLVCPPAYRDVTIAGTIDNSDHVNELNDLYLKLLRSVALLSEGGIFAYRQYSTQYKLQETLVEIIDYFKNQISKKHGLIRKNLLGKSVDYGTRAVISSNNYNNERLEDSMVDMDHSAVPISHCCSLFYPFIEAWLTNFFQREIINDPNAIVFYDQETNREVVGSIKDAEAQFSEKNIKKIINDYILNPDNRFKKLIVDVEIPLQKGSIVKKCSVILKGKVILPNNASTVLNRAMTVTDLLYLACVDVCEKRHIMVSRYPVGTDKGIYFNKIRVSSTRRHIKLIFNGKEYPFYPDINFNTEEDKVGIQFIDTLVMANAHLDGMGADLISKLGSARIVIFYKNKVVNA